MSETSFFNKQANVIFCNVARILYICEKEVEIKSTTQHVARKKYYSLFFCFL